jgi:tetratricopeptide (TPR) repeat protein
MKKNQLTLSLATLLLSFVLAGCASSGGNTSTAKKTDDQQQQAKTDVYLQGLTASPLTSASETCSVVKSTSWKTMVGKASACVRTGQWAQVEELAYELSRSDVDSPWGLYFYSLAAEGRKDYHRANWMIEAAIKKASPKVALFRYQKGRLMWLEKPSEAALKEIESAVKADPNLLDGHVFLGDARLRSWALSQAESHFSTALRLKSNSYEAVRGLADVKRLKGNIHDAIPLLAQAQGLKPTVLSTRIYLAAAYEEEKQHSEALSTYRSLRESITSGLIKEKPDFDVNEKIRSLESMIASNEAKAKQPVAPRKPAEKDGQKQEKK